MTTNPTPIADGEVEALREVLARTERRENGLRANMDEMTSLAHAIIKIAQRGALRPNTETGWLEPAEPRPRLTSLAEDNAKLRERVEEAVAAEREAWAEAALNALHGVSLASFSKDFGQGLLDGLSLVADTIRARSNLGGGDE